MCMKTEVKYGINGHYRQTECLDQTVVCRVGFRHFILVYGVSKVKGKRYIFSEGNSVNIGFHLFWGANSFLLE